MDGTRKLALVAGVLYLVTFVGSISALPLYHNLLHNPNYLLGRASDTGVLWGAVGEVICALAGIGTAVALYPVAERHSQTASLGLVTSRVIEAAMMMVGVLSVLSLVTLHKAGASGADATSMVTTGRALVALHDWTFLFGPGSCPPSTACASPVSVLPGHRRPTDQFVHAGGVDRHAFEDLVGCDEASLLSDQSAEIPAPLFDADLVVTAPGTGRISR